MSKRVSATRLRGLKAKTGLSWPEIIERTGISRSTWLHWTQKGGEGGPKYASLVLMGLNVELENERARGARGGRDL